LINGSGPALNADFNESFAAWQKLKNLYGASYSYTVNFNSWSGFKSKTTIEVVNNVVASRRYSAWNLKGKQINSISETRDNLGRHPEGARPRLIEDLYNKCEQTVLNKSLAKNYIYFTRHADGIMKTCVYVPKGCADDCAQGVNIGEIIFSRKK